MSVATCGGCKARWHQAGNRTGHCSGCHRTFSGVTTFDAHQRMDDGRNVCLDPATLTTKAGEPRFRLCADPQGCPVWRSDADLPDGTFR